ncbi:MAG: hypothetical protein PHC39_04790 [Proteiniphilum sp.]|nr:hypothetical protein [Proteiniphilum sp.]
MRHGADTVMGDYSQDCFGLSYVNGQPCDACDDKMECSEKYLSTHPRIDNPCNRCDDAQKYECDIANNCLMGIKTITKSPITCEYQKRWETICRSQTSTDPKDYIKYVSYSCANCFCRYPERKCEVKK